MAREQKVSEKYGRTRLTVCACGEDKTQVREGDTGLPVVLLCPTCDKAPLVATLDAERE